MAPKLPWNNLNVSKVALWEGLICRDRFSTSCHGNAISLYTYTSVTGHGMAV